MERVILEAKARNELIGKNRSKGLRNAGAIPGILYENEDSIPIQVSAKDFSAIVKDHGENAIIQLSMEGKKQQAYIKEVQRDPVKNHLLHFDLQPIAMDETMQVSVPVQIEGQDMVEKKGGIIQRQLTEIEIEALPNDIPRSIEVDISNLDIGDSLQVKALQAPDGVSIITDLEEVVLSVSEPTSQDLDQEDTEELEIEEVEETK